MSPHLILGAQAGHFGGPLFRIKSAPDCEAQGVAVAGLQKTHVFRHPVDKLSVPVPGGSLRNKQGHSSTGNTVLSLAVNNIHQL